ncbi:hypothetical protein FRC12_005486 [Ceratobasidium sp. 428]|nr:hypothetical protein FRC12_005486 [Ceratobasidium sp. 428]
MAQAASRFTTWLDSCQPVLLSEFNALAANVPPDIFEGVVEEVNCYGVDYDSGYILVHCRPVLWPPVGVGIIRHRFRLKYGGGLDYSQQEGNSFPAVTIWQDPNLAERLPPMLFQGRWLALRGQPAESNSPKCLKLQAILEMCEHLSRREFISANDSSFSASGPGWFYFALSECLRGCQSCFGGSWLGFHTTVFISGWGTRAIIEARDRYLKEKHPDCCYSSSPNLPNPYPEYPERGTATSATKQPSRTNIVASHSSQPRTLPSDSAELSNDLVGTSNRGKTRALKANRLRLSLPPSVTKQMSVPESEGTKISGQLKEAYPSTVVGRSSEENDFEANNSQEPIVAAKRTIVISEEAEGRKSEANKRIKVAHVGGAKERSGSSASKGNDANKLTSSGISKAMPISSVISLLIQHGCQDITQTLDLPACTEYPIFSGGFGDIFRGKLNDSAPVAIKCMRIVIDPYSSEHEKYLKACWIPVGLLIRLLNGVVRSTRDPYLVKARSSVCVEVVGTSPVSRTDSDGIALGGARSVAWVFDKAT